MGRACRARPAGFRGRFLKDTRFLIHDRDPVFGFDFSLLLRTAGVRCVRLPARSPNLNAFSERFVGSIRRECLGRVIPLGERHLRLLVAEYVVHYNLERNHQGIGNRLIAATPSPSAGAKGSAVCSTSIIVMRLNFGSIEFSDRTGTIDHGSPQLAAVTKEQCPC